MNQLMTDLANRPFSSLNWTNVTNRHNSEKREINFNFYT